MLKIVFKNPDSKPRPELAKRYGEIISSTISEFKCPSHNEIGEFELKFNAPDTYLIQVTACCPEFKATIENKISLMLS